MFSPGSSQKRKRVDKVVTLGGGQSETSDSDDSAVVLRPIGKIPHCDASSGRIYRNGDFLSINSDRKKFLLYRDVLHTLNPSTSQFETMKSTATTSFSNFPHEICYAIDAQGDRTIIGCSRGGEVFFASPTGGIYAQSQLECCKDLSDEVSTICAVGKSIEYWYLYKCFCVIVMLFLCCGFNKPIFSRLFTCNSIEISIFWYIYITDFNPNIIIL